MIYQILNDVKNIKVGNGLDKGIVSGPLIDKSSLEKVIDHVQDAVNIGAKIAVGGDVHSLGGNFYQPTVLSNVSTKAKITFDNSSRTWFLSTSSKLCSFNLEAKPIK